MVFENLKMEKITVELDSTVITRYGEQEGSKVGYNPPKRGRAYHHPLVAFIAETRRFIVVRKNIEKLPKATGKLLLFNESQLPPIYRYSAFVTNLDLPAEQVWNMYKDRGDAENRIKELKYDFAIDRFCMKKFWATEATFRMVMVAYNLT